jgi:fatty-acyl-CoA synthase
MVAAARREGMTVATGFAIAAQRCPNPAGLIDELGTLAWRELDQRSDALAAALQGLPGGQPKVTGIMARNHRGFVASLIAANRISANVLLLNTSFAGPALAEVVTREGVDAVIYDEEFTPTISQALHDRPEATRIVAWSDDPAPDVTSVAALIDGHAGQHPSPPATTAKMILLTSGTTGSPEGAMHSGGGPETIKGILDRTPWRAEEVTVIVAPMFHAWGFSQLLISTLMACTIVTRRKFDPEATLALVDNHQATGLCVVPVMFDRIVDMPDDVRPRYSGSSLRVAPDTAGKLAEAPTFGSSTTSFENCRRVGWAPSTCATPPSSTATPPVPAKTFTPDTLSSGDVGYLDAAGLLFVVGRDDEMIVSGGENVYPIEVEKTLATHAGVAEAAVLGIDDDQYGQRLVAFVVLGDGATASPDDLKAHVRENLANYKVPRAITVLDELPRGSTGKILRREHQALVEPP